MDWRSSVDLNSWMDHMSASQLASQTGELRQFLQQLQGVLVMVYKLQRGVKSRGTIIPRGRQIQAEPFHLPQGGRLHLPQGEHLLLPPRKRLYLTQWGRLDFPPGERGVFT